MGHKVNPISLRLGGIESWRSKWFTKKNYGQQVVSDVRMRNYIKKKLRTAAVSNIVIERSPQAVTFIIYSSRPGIIIGRGGTGVEDLKKELKRHVPPKSQVKVEIQEVKNPESDPRIVALAMAEQIEKRISFRRVLKQALDRSINSQGVEGVKVMVAGRLDGAEMSRREWLAEGRLPLHTLRANIDYALDEAITTYGKIGIKVWIYKGEVFDKKEKDKEEAKKK